MEVGQQPPDPNFVYETRFDWVRVYQTQAQNPTLTAIARNVIAPLSPSQNDEDAGKGAHKASLWYDLSGRRVNNFTQGHGIVVNGEGQKKLLPFGS